MRSSAAEGGGLPVLVGRRARLRAWRADDADAIHRACQDPAIQRWTRVPSPYREGDAEGFLRHGVPAVHAAGGAAFCLETLDADHLAGSMALHGLDDGVGEIGYWVAPWARGRGVAADALDVLSRWCFDHLGAARLAPGLM